MAEVLKLKINGTVSADDIPEDTEELELECDDIAKPAFSGNKKLRILKLVNVKKIHNAAFYNMKSLRTLETVNCGIIAPDAFAECRALSKLKITGTDIICGGAFKGCRKLAEIELENCNEIRGFAFKGLKALNRAALDCRIIGWQAFYGCENLYGLTLKNTLSIEKEAFYGCGLTEVCLPDTLVQLGSRAFGCCEIYHLTIPPSVKRLGDDIIFFGYQWIHIENITSEKWTEIDIYIDEKGRPSFYYPNQTHKSGGVIASVNLTDPEKGSRKSFKFVVLDDFEDVLTENGIDFREYDRRILQDKDYENRLIKAALLRIKERINMTPETLKSYKIYVSAALERVAKSELDIKAAFDPGSGCSDCNEYMAFKDDFLLYSVINLIGYARQRGLMTVEKKLTELLNKKTENLDELYVEELTQAVENSSRQGMTELTALLMQKFHEKRSGGI